MIIKRHGKEEISVTNDAEGALFTISLPKSLSVAGGEQISTQQAPLT